MAEPDASRGERNLPALKAAASNAMVRIKADFYGKGPSRARSYFFDRYVIVVLEGLLTTVERTLRDGGEEGLVREVRLTFEDLMTTAFTEEIQQVTGYRVVGYHSQILPSVDTAVEVFVLDPDQPLESSGEASSARRRGPDDEGAADRLPDGAQLADTSARLPWGEERPGPAETGPIRSAVSNALLRLLTEQYGRGAEVARTYMTEDHLFCVLEGVLTRVERTLVEGGQQALVRRLRIRFHDLASEAFHQEIETLTGRRVAASQAQVTFDPDTLFLVFALADDDGAF